MKNNEGGSSLNIWILNHYAVTPDMPGGTRHFDLSRALARRGYKVTVFASSFNYTKHQELRLEGRRTWKMENVDGVKFVWLKTYPYQRNDWRRIINMISYMVRSYTVGRRLPIKHLGIGLPDIIIGSSVHLLAVLSAYVLAKHFKARFIMEVRDIWPDTIADMNLIKRKSIVFKILKVIEIFLYRKAERIIFVPPFAAKYFKEIGVCEDKIRHIPNGVDLTRFPIQNSHELPNEAKYIIVYAGSLGPSADIQTAIEAMHIVVKSGYNDVILNLIGDGSEKRKLTEMVVHNNLERNVVFIGSVPKDKVNEYLQSSFALLHIESEFNLSKWGGSPNKIFDYLACSKPIIYSSNFVKDILDPINCGIYAEPGDPVALARVIMAMIMLDNNKRKKFGENARIYVESNHDINVLAGKLIAALRL